MARVHCAVGREHGKEAPCVSAIEGGDDGRKSGVYPEAKIVSNLRERADPALARRAHPHGHLRPNYVPSVILLGPFLAPITVVSYLYERLPTW
jgi:hypothetical protein